MTTGRTERTGHHRVPARTERLAFRRMSAADLDDMAALLGDPEVMRYYARAKDRTEAMAWIDWNQRLYQQEGFGLWLITLQATGEFVGDCGLTPQEVEGTLDIELGYHIRTALQGRGYATEAAAACRDHAREVLGTKRLIAMIHPDNTPSQRVAQKVGLSYERDAVSRAGLPIQIYAAQL
ncbi:RimJ/RimL family protein N-acetyltransferase [Kitasatospora sp. MAP12-15]|uniref:GNAT family N-acetyltransferase n=1 Tax=unclassified Kitasatospora TaxID=2633591 RepID=UPI002474E738|nr:GNAT family N-acetyltransferase [Kitasatospora sp. MAP12-44]MDH6115139.1 RimJ/RimL family protein N-acetyltransferase [Kitasatospora sp. MAP12-44]